MPERHFVIDHQKFSYEGLFNSAELYNLISSYFFEKGWDWHEKMNREMVTPNGKQIQLVLMPWKNVSDYYKLQTQIKLHLINIKEVDVEHENQTLKLNTGMIKITIDGYIVTDRKEMWTKPWQWFLTFILDKYFFRTRYGKFEDWLKKDLDDLLHKIKSYLNLYKYSYEQ